MEYTKLGYTDLKVSRLCLGGMSFGSSKWMADPETSRTIIKNYMKDLKLIKFRYDE